MGYIFFSEEDIEEECNAIMDRLFSLSEEQDIFDLFISEMKKHCRDKMLLDFIVDGSYDFDWLEEGLEEVIIPACEALNEIACNDRVKNIYVNHLKKYYPDNGLKDKVMAVFSKHS